MIRLSLALCVVIASSAHAQELPRYTDCALPAAPAPGAEGGWGPVFRVDEATILPTLDVYALGSRDHHVDVRVYLGDGSVVEWRQGTYGAVGEARTFEVGLELPAGIDGRIARVTVVVEAIDSTGAPMAHRAARVYAWRDARGGVRLADDGGAPAALARALEDGDDVLVGKEVSL